MNSSIDAHCHIGQGEMAGWEAEQLLASMDRLHISQAVIVPWDQAIAVYNKQGNDEVLRLSREYPTRFIPFCTVNPWYKQEALRELNRSVELGAKGLKLHPVYQGFQLTDPHVIPVIQRAVERGVPIYIPTGTPVNSLPLQLKYVAEQFPEGVFIQGHFGSTDFWIDALPSVEHTPNIYIDTSYNMPSIIDTAIKVIGAERVLFSSDAPYLSQESEWAKMSLLNISQADKKKITGDNLRRLLSGGQHDGH